MRKRISTVYLSELTYETLEQLKRIFGFRSRSQLIENISQLLWANELVRQFHRLSEEQQARVLEEILNQLEERGSSLPKKVRESE